MARPICRTACARCATPSPGDQRRWVDRLAADHPNVRATLAWPIERGATNDALRLSRGLMGLWIIQVHLKDGARWLEAALATGDGSDPDARVWAMLSTSILRWAQGDFAGAEEQGRRALVIAEAHDLTFGAAMALFLLHDTLMTDGRLDEARTLRERAIERMRASGNRTWLAYALADVGLRLCLSGETTRGETLIEEGLALHIGNGYKHSDLGILEHDAGDDAAAHHYAESVRLLYESGDRWCLATPLAGIAAIAAAAGRLCEAARLLGVASARRLGQQPAAGVRRARQRPLRGRRIRQRRRPVRRGAGRRHR